MSLNREAVYAALAALVFDDPRASVFVTKGRFLPQVFAGIDADSMPALFMFQLPEQRSQITPGAGVPSKRTLYCSFVAYFASASQGNDTLPATMINNAADILDDVISTPGNPQNVQTLGGLVTQTYIAPTMSPYEGLLQEKSVLVATVAMLVP